MSNDSGCAVNFAFDQYKAPHVVGSDDPFYLSIPNPSFFIPWTTVAAGFYVSAMPPVSGLPVRLLFTSKSFCCRLRVICAWSMDDVTTFA